MEKVEFVRIAPSYYELAVVLAVQTKQDYVADFELRRMYIIHPVEATEPNDTYCLIGNKDLLRIAITNLVEQQVIEALNDPFGPSQFKAGIGLDEYMSEQRQNIATPLYKATASGDVDWWLKDALLGLDRVAYRIGITSEGFQDPERDWTPIPLDRTDARVQKAIERVDEAITHVEQNNGYGTAYPEERQFVLDNLKLLSNTLKNAASTSITYIKTHGLNALQKLQDRFGTALIGEAARDASKALWTLIKEAAKAVL